MGGNGGRGGVVGSSQPQTVSSRWLLEGQHKFFSGKNNSVQSHLDSDSPFDQDYEKSLHYDAYLLLLLRKDLFQLTVSEGCIHRGGECMVHLTHAGWKQRQRREYHSWSSGSFPSSLSSWPAAIGYMVSLMVTEPLTEQRLSWTSSQV